MTNRNDAAQIVDMSAAAVARRLDVVQSLYELMVHLRGARVVGAGPLEPLISDRRTSEQCR